MPDNQVVSNSYLSNNPDLAVRSTLTAGGHLLQHLRIDKGTGGAESTVTDANPLPVTGSLSLTPAATTSVGDDSLNVTTAGTRVQLPSVACRQVIITAKNDNTGIIWVGGSAVAAGRGRPLVSLQAVTLDVSNLNQLYIDSTVNGEGITYLYIV